MIIAGNMPLIICTRCKKVFYSLSVAPVQCPRCGSVRTMPLSLVSLALIPTYKKMWKRMEKDMKEKAEKASEGNNAPGKG